MIFLFLCGNFFMKKKALKDEKVDISKFCISIIFDWCCILNEFQILSPFEFQKDPFCVTLVIVTGNLFQFTFFHLSPLYFLWVLALLWHPEMKIKIPKNWGEIKKTLFKFIHWILVMNKFFLFNQSKSWETLSTFYVCKLKWNVSVMKIPD